MTIKQAAKYLGIKSLVTVRKYADSGVLACEKLPSPNGEWRIFKKRDLDVFKAKMRKDPLNGMAYIAPYTTGKKGSKK